MKRISITSILGNTFGAVLEDPTSWINSQIANNGWGLPQRELPAEQCSDSDIASALSSRVQDNGDGTNTTFYTLPAQYTIVIIDMTAEIDAQNQKNAQIQTFKQAVKTILQKADVDVTAADVKTALLKFLRQALLNGDLD